MMLEPFDSNTAVFDFDELADHLLEQGLDTSPAAIHGCLCGLLAAGAASEPELAPAALLETLDVQVHGELAERVMQLYTASAAALVDEAFDFHPLLPDDECDIQQRTAALGHWCRGFLAGYGLVTAGAERQQDNRAGAETEEILGDMAVMIEAAVDEEAEEEESENSYFELVEYLRFATLNIHADSLAAAEETAHSSPPDTLH